MSALRKCAFWALGLAAVLHLGAAGAVAQCKLTVSSRRFEGAQRTVITLENERILVEVVPELEGRVSRYQDKSRTHSAFESLEDCPYHFAGRWEGKPFTYRIDARGPDRAAVAVQGGGTIPVGLLHSLLGVDLTAPLTLSVERTISIDAHSTRLRVDVAVTNVGEGVAPSFRYMVHAVFGNVPAMDGGRAFWFLPTSGGVEFFEHVRGGKEMGIAAGGAPVDHPFSRFIPGRQADKPRYEAGGWAAWLTSAGPAFMFYDHRQFDFMQYWFGGDAEWHLSLEPHSKPVDLRPGQSAACSFTLAYDSRDVPFQTATLAYERPLVPETIVQGGLLKVCARATTVENKPEPVGVAFAVKDPQGKVLLAKTVGGEARPFAFTDLSAEAPIAATAALGQYHWSMSGGDGRELASGVFEVVSAEEQGRRQLAKATAELRAKLDELGKKCREEEQESRKFATLWKDGANLALQLDDRNVWPAGPPPAGAAVGYRPAVVPVLGLWREKELPTIKTLAASPSAAWPEEPEKLLAGLRSDRVHLRDVVSDAAGKGLVALLVDRARKRTEIASLGAKGAVRRFGRYADKPGESDDTLGAGARAVAVDPAGNVWVATDAWGPTSVFRRGPDGSPLEESVLGVKGALKKFSPEGKLLGTVSLLDAPMDLALARADGAGVILATYRSVSEYHGAQVREGIMMVQISSVARIGEIKAPAGSVSVDTMGRIWAADVAGHISCHDIRGRKLFDVAASPAPAVLDAKLPAGSSLPVIVRAGGEGGVWALFTLAKNVVFLDAKGEARGNAKPVDEAAGTLLQLSVAADGPLVIAEKVLWRP
jgi:hypothetical protein